LILHNFFGWPSSSTCVARMFMANHCRQKENRWFLHIVKVLTLIGSQQPMFLYNSSLETHWNKNLVWEWCLKAPSICNNLLILVWMPISFSPSCATRSYNPMTKRLLVTIMYHPFRFCFLFIPVPQKPWFWFSGLQLQIKIDTTVLKIIKSKIVSNNFHLLQHLVCPMLKTTARCQYIQALIYLWFILRICQWLKLYRVEWEED
jgi:hypothetical protein